ncbi:MAG: cobalamin biosynthesis protein [Bdellovibrionales bacterium]|nr:cobalamin biosynthesis protein [Massilia sp.]
MIAGLSEIEIALLLLCGVLLDFALGEARRWHPLVGFGKLASALERALNRGSWRVTRGVMAWTLAVVPLTALAAWTTYQAGYVMHAVLLYLCLGLRSLRDHNLPIARALCKADLGQARLLTARIVSRDTMACDEAALAKASAESLLENGNDAVFGTLFWFAVAGGTGALVFRLANTLDAMWGYRSSRYLYYGRAAARLDDALNYIPARLTALSYVLLADDRKAAWRCWRQQAPAWSSPNAGPVMASGAGALGLELGGAAIYDGVEELRPALGAGRPAAAGDIIRAWRLVRGTTFLWLAVAATMALSTAFWRIAHA